MERENHTQFAKGLVELFYPLVETAVFTAEGALLESFNLLSTAKEDQTLDVETCSVHSSFMEVLASGKNVKSVVYPLHRENAIIGYLRVRYDLSVFTALQQQLNFLIQPCQAQPTIDSWKVSIDKMIDAYIAEHKITIQAMSAKQKRALIVVLQEKGLFDFKESSVYVATKLNISRATVYNYLKTAADLRNVCVHQVDAFTSEKFGGNPAGVVLDAAGLDEMMMRKIARELNVSETAFVFPSKKAAFQLRYFTPTGHEVGFCGHSTVGSLYMIAKENRFGIGGEGLYQFDVETAYGVLKMEAHINKDEEIQVSYETPVIKLQKIDTTHGDISLAGGFEERLIDPSFPVMYEATNKDLFVVVRSLEALKAIECNPKSFAAFAKQHDIVALCLFCPEALNAENQFHMRCFAPLVGIPEDPFTGSVLGGLTAYVDTFGMLSNGITSFRVEQGHFMERPGAVEVAFSKKGKAYHAKVFAQAVHCFSTAITLT